MYVQMAEIAVKYSYEWCMCGCVVVCECVFWSLLWGLCWCTAEGGEGDDDSEVQMLVPANSSGT